MTAALNVHEQELSEWVPNFNAFFATFAAQAPSLGAAVAVCRGRCAPGRGFAALDAAFPSARILPTALLPGVEARARTIAASAVDRTGAGLARAERARRRRQGPAQAAPAIAQLFSEQLPFYKQTKAFSKCLTKVFYPAGNTKLQDGSNTSGVEGTRNSGTRSRAGRVGQNFDGNGVIDRFLVGGSGQTLRSATGRDPGTTLKAAAVAHAPLPPLGTRPAFPGERAAV